MDSFTMCEFSPVCVNLILKAGADNCSTPLYEKNTVHMVNLPLHRGQQKAQKLGYHPRKLIHQKLKCIKRFVEQLLPIH
jgi:hypothetical protein